MSTTRATLRTAIQQIADTGATEYSAAQLNRWINEALLSYSNAVPAHTRATSTVTGTTITLTQRADVLDYLIINAVEFLPLRQEHGAFVSGGNYYDLQNTENGTTIELATTQTSAPYTISYRSPLPILTDDLATSIPDNHKHIIYHHVLTSILKKRLADEIETATNAQLITFIRTAMGNEYQRYYEALSLAEAHDAQGITV